MKILKKGVTIMLCSLFTIALAACSNDTKSNSDSVDNIQINEVSKKQSDELLSNSEYLPIGTVVTVGNESKKMMIIGLLQVKSENNEVYDYSGVLYPEGYLGPSETYLFNKEQISRIYHLGYTSQEQTDHNKKLEDLSSSMGNK